ncbi:hypothetical protein V5O48_016718 [Marasmius crinis-equi]|uniref:Uncharacterized protein n=1 Tax=Marasmius crinis-equi TaxID=585013 RepID=A0ABR3EQY6_9AGAR
MAGAADMLLEFKHANPHKPSHSEEEILALKREEEAPPDFPHPITTPLMSKTPQTLHTHEGSRSPKSSHTRIEIRANKRVIQPTDPGNPQSVRRSARLQQ